MWKANLTRPDFSDSVSSIGVTTVNELPSSTQSWIPGNRDIVARKGLTQHGVSAPRLLVDNSISTYPVFSAARDFFAQDYLFSISSHLASPATNLRLAEKAHQNLKSIIDEIESLSLKYSSPDLRGLSQKAVEAMQTRQGEDLSELADELSEQGFD